MDHAEPPTNWRTQRQKSTRKYKLQYPLPLLDLASSRSIRSWRHTEPQPQDPWCPDTGHQPRRADRCSNRVRSPPIHQPRHRTTQSSPTHTCAHPNNSDTKRSNTREEDNHPSNEDANTHISNCHTICTTSSDLLHYTRYHTYPPLSHTIQSSTPPVTHTTSTRQNTT